MKNKLYDINLTKLIFFLDKYLKKIKRTFC